MKLIKCALSALIVTFFASAIADIGIADMQKIFASQAVQNMQKSLESKFSKKRESIVNLMTAYQNEKKDFEKNKAVMTKKDIAKKQEALDAEQQKLQKEQNAYQQELIKAQNEAMQEFIKKIKAAAVKVSENEGLETIFANNSVLYSKNSKEVTEKLIKALD